jgi:hypothetical protein
VQASAFTDQGLASLLWAFGTLNHVPGPALLGPVEAEIQRRSGEMEMLHVAQILWGFATLSHVPDPAVCAALQVRSGCSLSRRRLIVELMLADVTPDPRNTCSGRYLGTAVECYAAGIAVSNPASATHTQARLDAEDAARAPPHQQPLPANAAAQLFQAYLAGTDLPGAWSFALPQSLVAAARRVWVEQLTSIHQVRSKAQPPRPPPSHITVGGRLCITPLICDGGSLLISIVVACRGARCFRYGCPLDNWCALVWSVALALRSACNAGQQECPPTKFSLLLMRFSAFLGR